MVILVFQVKRANLTNLTNKRESKQNIYFCTFCDSALMIHLKGGISLSKSFFINYQTMFPLNIWKTGAGILLQSYECVDTIF